MQAGDRVRCVRDDLDVEGVVLPTAATDALIIKLDSGYNVGVDPDAAAVTVLEAGAQLVDADTQVPEASAVATDPDLPTVALVSTGGTIASTVDYRTGAVSARFDAEDVLRAIPALAELANYRGRVVANILSENMTAEIWQELARVVAAEVDAGADGVVVMHGTDTMQYTAAALAFMLETPVPVVLTGAQRSADRPSSDNVMNAVSAVRLATADAAGVFVCMHAGPSDDVCAVHAGTRVRKNHTSRRDAFATVDGPPVGSVSYPDGAVTLDAAVPARGDGDLTVAPALETDVELLYFSPGGDVAALGERLRERAPAGLVIAGTGLGHVHAELIDAVGALVEAGTVVAMTSQCLGGRVCDRVYANGRDLLAAGVVEAGETLPAVAKVKLMWALANTDDPAAAMQADLRGENRPRSVTLRELPRHRQHRIEEAE